MRQGRTFKRCTCCGAQVLERVCECGSTKHTWTFVVDVAPLGAKRRQVKRGGFATKKAALEAMGELQGEVHNGTHVERSKLTLGDYLRRHWLPAQLGRVRAG